MERPKDRIVRQAGQKGAKFKDGEEVVVFRFASQCKARDS